MSRKKRLLIVLGAGSSVTLGMPRVADIDHLMRNWSADFTRNVHRGDTDLFDFLWQSLQRYNSREPKEALRQPVNYENTLGEMVALAAWMRPPAYGMSLREAVAASTVPPIDWQAPQGYGPFAEINMALTHLLKQLARHFREKSLRLQLGQGPGFKQYQSIFAALQAEFEIGIYNLNHDCAAVLALPQLFTGFDQSGQFVPNQLHQRQEWEFLYHLHGCVHHTLAEERTGTAIRWQSRLDAHFDDGNIGRSTQDQSENLSFPATTLIAGGHKLDQLLNEPFHSMHATLVRHSYEADAILIGGYGFADVHVNRALQNRFARGGQRPPVVILDWSGTGTDPMEFRHDAWALEVCKSLQVPATSFRAPGAHAPPDVQDLIQRRTMEVAEPHAVAIWHGGFIEASSLIDDVIGHLR